MLTREHCCSALPYVICAPSLCIASVKTFLASAWEALNKLLSFYFLFPCGLPTHVLHFLCSNRSPVRCLKLSRFLPLCEPTQLREPQTVDSFFFFSFHKPIIPIHCCVVRNACKLQSSTVAMLRLEQFCAHMTLM